MQKGRWEAHVKMRGTRGGKKGSWGSPGGPGGGQGGPREAQGGTQGGQGGAQGPITISEFPLLEPKWSLGGYRGYF
jgi:hypothetical protein